MYGKNKQMNKNHQKFVDWNVNFLIFHLHIINRPNIFFGVKKRSHLFSGVTWIFFGEGDAPAT